MDSGFWKAEMSDAAPEAPPLGSVIVYVLVLPGPGFGDAGCIGQWVLL